MEADEEIRHARVELAVDRRGMGHHCQTGLCDLGSTIGILEGGVWRREKLVSDVELCIGEVGRLPDGKACRVAVPVVVRFSDVADVVEFLSRVVLVDVAGLTVDNPVEVIAGIFNAPDPMETVLSYKSER